MQKITTYRTAFIAIFITLLAILFYPNWAHIGVTNNSPRNSASIDITEIVTGLEYPWAIAVMPDGKFIVTERSGNIRIASLDGKVSAPLANVPSVFFKGQGGLLDITLDPDFLQNSWIYFSYAEPDEKGLAGTAVARARIEGSALADIEVIFRQQPKTEGKNHFGSRLSFAPDDTLFIGLGERFDYSEDAQKPNNHLGKVVRIHKDGSVPNDNPFASDPKALPEIWSFGHRNIQGMDLHPTTGKVWIHEHGPRGGDEINIPEAGKNYGWPKASYGSHYSYIPIEDNHAKQGFVEPLHHWTPSIAPSGMLFYTGELFPDWQGDIFVGALAGQHLAHVSLKNDKVISEEKLLTRLEERIRDVTQGPDGAIYVLTDSDDGKILRLMPKR